MQKESIVLGGGCFWCTEAAYKLVEGVVEVISGYAGGEMADPTYEAVCSGQSDHAEVIQVSFDAGMISLKEILEIFWLIHDPTTLNRQGNDVGSQYRSIILYSDPKQQKIAQESVKTVSGLWENPIVTEIKKLNNFYPAEDYHQDYFAQNPEQAYCQVVINPKLAILRKKLASKLK